MRSKWVGLLLVLAVATVAVGILPIWEPSPHADDELFNQIEAKVHQAVEAEGRYPVVNVTELVVPFVRAGMPLADARATLERFGFALVKAPRATQPGFDERYVAGRRSRKYNLLISYFEYVIVVDVKDETIGALSARAVHTAL